MKCIKQGGCTRSDCQTECRADKAYKEPNKRDILIDRVNSIYFKENNTNDEHDAIYNGAYNSALDDVIRLINEVHGEQ